MQKTENATIAHKDPKLPPPLVVPAGSEWLAGLQNIEAAQAETLCAAVHTLYPHDAIAETCYRRVVYHLDRLAQAPEAATTLHGFCALLDQAFALPFHQLAESYRVQALKQIEQSSEFFFVQRLSVRYLYDDVEVWAAFGYQGASVHLGGYIKRGFDDLDWLPPLPNNI
jgi:hypothetical protein